MKNLILVISFVLLHISQVSGQVDREPEKWKYVAGKDDIKVYNRAVATSKIKALKAEIVLDASATEVVDLLMDIPAAVRWVSHTKSCVLVRKISANELYYYTEVDLPWPLDNRDFVAHIKVSEEPLTKVVTVNAPAVPGWVEKKKGIVRIDHSLGSWTIAPMPGRKVRIEYILQVDPGGMLPAQIVNHFAIQGPIDTFTNMKKELALRRAKINNNK